MDGFYLEDFELLSNRVIYELAAYLGVNNAQDRIDNKRALFDIYNWALDKAKSPNAEDILKVVRAKERQVGGNFQESRLATLRRETMMDMNQPKAEDPYKVWTKPPPNKTKEPLVEVDVRVKRTVKPVEASAKRLAKPLVKISHEREVAKAAPSPTKI